MISAFIHIRLLDIIDMILVAILFYQLYMLIRGTVAYTITLGIAIIYLFWWAVRALQMELLSTILGSVLGVGVIALIIVFQQEIRRFLIYLGSRYVDGNRISIEKIAENKWKVNIPKKYHIGHEAHFAQVTEKYLGYLVDGKLPDWEVPNMIAKYYTTTQGLKMVNE